MNTTSAVVLTGVTVAAGQYAQDKKIQVRTFVGVGVLAIMLAALSEADAKLAGQFATLVLVGAVLIYAVPIAKALGYTK